MGAALHFFPWQPQRRVFQEIQFPARQLLLLPIVDWYGLWRGRKLVPQIFDKLELLGGAEIKDRRWVHSGSPLQFFHIGQSGDLLMRRIPQFDNGLSTF